MGRSSVLFVVICGALLMLSPMSFGLGGWADPPGGWDWFDNDFDDLAEWNHDNGSDAWDGSAPGQEGTAPGGVSVDVIPGAGDPSGDATVLSIEDTGDPRDAGFADPSNRKVYLQYEAAAEGNIFEGGVTFIARLRVNPQPIEAPADGYTLHNGGKGNVGIVHDSDIAGDAVSYNLSFALDTGGLLYFGRDDQTPLEVGDEFQFHTVWATAELAGDVVSLNVYVDGDIEPAFSGDITLNDGRDANFANYVAVGMGSTTGDGALQIDYVGSATGVHPPELATAVAPRGKMPTFWGDLKSE